MIFVVEDERVLRKSLVEFLATTGHPVEGFETAEKALEAARASAPDLVVTDLQLPGMHGVELVRELGELEPTIVRIVVTAHGSVQSAVQAMRFGCYEYLEKPLDLDQLRRVVDRALAARRSKRELAWVRGQTKAVEDILGASDAMEELRRQVSAVAEVGTESPPVLITGETGVGKGLVARAIHLARFGDDAPWIELNCAALPNTLVEAELFGYERSAFTDAKQAKPGLFEAATGGTLFLDEIGEMALDVQAKLLKALESGRVRRLGAVRDRPYQAAVIAASNVELPEAVREGAFRADLFHRLAALTIEIPPLRRRAGDAVELAQRFTRQYAAKYKKSAERLSAAAEQKVAAASWPGNVRELRFAIERAVILTRREAVEIGPEALQVDTDVSASMAPAAAPGASVIASYDGVRVSLPEEGVAFDDLERAILKAALDRTGGNVVAAARLLGLQRDAVRYRIRKLGIDGRGGGAGEPEGT